MFCKLYLVNSIYCNQCISKILNQNILMALMWIQFWRNAPRLIMTGFFRPLEVKLVVSRKMESAMRMAVNSISLLPENCWSTKKRKNETVSTELKLSISRNLWRAKHISRETIELNTVNVKTRIEYYGHNMARKMILLLKGNPKCRHKLAGCLHFSYLIYWTYLCNFLSSRTKINKRYVDKVSTKTNGYSLFL